MSKAHDGAETKGRLARLAGKPRDACPYKDKRKANGRLTGSRGFRNAWFAGWDNMDQKIRWGELGEGDMKQR